jgi:hypothetical protein
MLGGSHFFVKIVNSNFWGKFYELPRFFKNNSHYENCLGSLIVFTIMKTAAIVFFSPIMKTTSVL